MKAEASSSEGQCKSCYEHNQLILLSCGHAFCVRCVTFAYHKHKLNMNRVSQTRCCLCEKVVELGDVELRMIN